MKPHLQEFDEALGRVKELTKQLEDREAAAFEVDGAGPLARNIEIAEKLEIPEHQRLEFALEYFVAQLSLERIEKTFGVHVHVHINPKVKR